MKNSFLFIFTAFLVFLSACGEGGEVMTESTEVFVEAETPKEEENYSFVPPSPLKVANIFRKAGLKYDEQLPNPPGNVTGYSTFNQKALNFGVYSADLAYCILHKQPEKGSDYLKAIRQLGNEIGLASVFSTNNIVSRFETNISNTDSIVELLTEIQSATDDYIQEYEENDLSAIYYTGAWIEGMFLGAETAMDSKDKKLGTKLAEQMNIAVSILRGLQSMEDRAEDIVELENEIKGLIKTFNQFESVKKLGEDIAFLDAELSAEEVSVLAGKIIELRTKITKP